MVEMRALVLTVSDRVSRGEAEDRSGPAAAARLEALDLAVTRRVVGDGIGPVAAALRLAIEDGFDLVMTAGGTGMSPRDLTPEATALVLDRKAPGISEAMRAATFGVNPHGMLSRGVSGTAGHTLIINLPGSVSGVTESLDVIAPALGHALALLRGSAHGH